MNKKNSLFFLLTIPIILFADSENVRQKSNVSHKTSQEIRTAKNHGSAINVPDDNDYSGSTRHHRGGPGGRNPFQRWT